MKGFITTWDVLRHPVTIIGEFGIRVYLRCLVRIARRNGRAVTFLECLDAFEPSAS